MRCVREPYLETRTVDIVHPDAMGWVGEWEGVGVRGGNSIQLDWTISNWCWIDLIPVARHWASNNAAGPKYVAAGNPKVKCEQRKNHQYVAAVNLKLKS